VSAVCDLPCGEFEADHGEWVVGEVVLGCGGTGRGVRQRPLREVCRSCGLVWDGQDLGTATAQRLAHGQRCREALSSRMSGSQIVPIITVQPVRRICIGKGCSGSPRALVMEQNGSFIPLPRLGGVGNLMSLIGVNTPPTAAATMSTKQILSLCYTASDKLSQCVLRMD
jgi:hypothetical protein